MILLWELFAIFFKIGALTFGGGYAMLSMVNQEVLNRGWMNTEELIDFLAVSESTPGPFAINISTYVGAKTAGLPGALAATIGVILPSFIVIVLIFKAYKTFNQSKAVKGLMSGLRPCVVGLIGASAFAVFMTIFFQNHFSWDAFKTMSFYGNLFILIAASYLSFIKKSHPVKVILFSALCGILLGYLGLL